MVAADLPTEMKAAALFCLAETLKTQAEIPSLLTVMSKKPELFMTFKLRAGADYLDRMEKEQSAREGEALRLFRRVAEEYGEVKYRGSTLGERTRRAIYEMEHLLVGKAAPEIVGEDLDGNQFKLSDYRGKVVLLDFWGHW
jgi:hypothetical protein